MFIILGFGKQTTRNFGAANPCNCGHCNNHVEMQLLKVTRWITLFFIPVIPYRNLYVSACPICNTTKDLTEIEFLKVLKYGELSNKEKYAGKNETQINYLKQMEELKNRG